MNVRYTNTLAGIQTAELLAYDNSGNLLGHAALSYTGPTSYIPPVGPGTVTTLGSGWTAPAALATNTAGMVYVADSATGNTYKIAPGASTQTLIASGFSSPSSMVEVWRWTNLRLCISPTSARIPSAVCLRLQPKTRQGARPE